MLDNEDDVKITMTGIDHTTVGDNLKRLLIHKNVEPAVLYTYDPENRRKYPERVVVQSLLQQCKGRGAIHICGTRAREQLRKGELEDLIPLANRIQINGVFERSQIEQLCKVYPDHTIITQWRLGYNGVVEVNAANHAILVDASGGRGIVPKKWFAPETDKPIGFAGGLEPSNIAYELQRIWTAGYKPDWIDMESGIRTDDWFDINKALTICEAIRSVLCSYEMEAK